MPGAGVDAGATCAFADASSPATTITCTDDGTYTVKLTATDGVNAPVSSTATVTVSNAAPAVAITSPAAGSTYTPGTAVPLSASFTDAGTNDSHTCSITWGDGTPASSGTVTEANGSGTCAASHTYAASGSQTITITVTDDDTGAGSATRVLAPPATALLLKQGVLGQTLALIPTASAPDRVRLAVVAVGVGISTAPSFWVDGNHLKESNGSSVFLPRKWRRSRSRTCSPTAPCPPRRCRG